MCMHFITCLSSSQSVYYLQRILTSTSSMHVYVATHEWLQPKTDFHRIVRMYNVVIRKVGQVVLCSAMYAETSTGQHQGDAVLHCKEYTKPVELGPYRHIKRSEVPGQLHSTITPQMLHQEQKYLGMLSMKLLGN